MAAEIMGSSISDQESGLMNSVYDGLSNVSATGISYGKNQSFLLKSNKEDRSGRVLKDLSVIAMTALPVYIHYLLNVALKKVCLAVVFRHSKNCNTPIWKVILLLDLNFDEMMLTRFNYFLQKQVPIITRVSPLNSPK